MSRLRGWARLWFWVLGPAVLLTLLVTLAQNLSGRLGYALFTVEAPETPDGYPRVRSIRDPRGSALEPGDVLLRAGESSLQGAGSFRVHARVLEARPEDRPVRVEIERGGERLTLDLDVSPPRPSREVIGLMFGAALLPIGMLMLLRAPRDPRALVLFLTMSAYALNQLWFPGGPALFTWGWMAMLFASQLFYAPLFVLVGVHWLERSPARWEKVLPWGLAVMPFLRLDSMHEFWLPTDAAMAAFSILDVVMLVSGLCYLVYNYRNSDALGRRQLRWVFFGLAAGLLPLVFWNLLSTIEPSLGQMRPLMITGLFVPLGFLMAVVYSDLLDIDRLIGASTSYTVLGVVLLSLALIVIPRASEAVAPIVGFDPGAAQAVFSILAAAVIVPANRQLRPRIQKLFFAERLAFERGIQELLANLSRTKTPETLTRTAGEGLVALLRPDLCAIYAVDGDSLSPVFAEGGAVPPALPADGPLLAALVEEPRPMAARVWRRLATQRGEERAGFEALDAAVLLPVTREGSLVFLICLGTKRSADIYTNTDLALLARVADRMSAELLLFDEADVLSQARDMQERLRRYVPGAVVERLTRGEEVAPGEREVTVLFVDIRGYTGLSEKLEAPEIFATVNRYTQCVSAVIDEHDGAVVEFHGDGLMAVFGAHDEGAAKERNAVEAASAIPGALETLAGEEGGPRLSVGVGVATGPAFVGNVRGHDREIWSVLGNTTNLAARLEALTRELDAVAVIDATTWERSGSRAADFECRSHIAIRGRSGSQDVYVLPLEAQPREDGAATDADEDWTGRVLAGRYQVDARLGAGGMASVYRATDRRLDRPVVIKVPHKSLLLREGFRERFAQEVRHLTRLEHPHVVKIHDVGEHQRVPYAVVQYLGGGDLRQRLNAKGEPLAPDEVTEWLPDLASALDHVHGAGFVHRDIKPDNVLFDEDGHVFLSDLGIATALADAPAGKAESDLAPADNDPALTRPGMLLGAASYTPPEAIDRELSPEYDQYGLGVVVYEALSGRLPFEDLAPGELLLAKLSDEPVPLASRAPDLPGSLSTTVMHALAREPGQRFPSCGAFAAEVQAALHAGA